MAARGGRWAWHYRVLTDLRDALLRDREEKLHEVAGLTIEPHSMHPADSATDEFDHELSLALLSAEQNGLSEVNDAILRIITGRYGICEETGRPIPAARLRAVPWARYTAEVEQRFEKSGELPKPHLEAAMSLRGVSSGSSENRTTPADEGEEAPEPHVPEMLEFDTGIEEEEPATAVKHAPRAESRPHHALRPGHPRQPERLSHRKSKTRTGKVP